MLKKYQLIGVWEKLTFEMQLPICKEHRRGPADMRLLPSSRCQLQLD